MRITVLLGGTSAERDVSLASGLRIAQALRERGHDVLAIDTARGALAPAEERAMLAGRVVKTIPPDVESLARLDRELPARLDIGGHGDQPGGGGQPDVVFLALHGGRGEDGTLQALLDLTGVPYTGSGHLASALAMDKDLSKHLFRAAGVPTADWMMWRADPSGVGNPGSPAAHPEGGDARSPTPDAVATTLGFPVVVKPSKQGSTVGLSVVREPEALAGAIREAARFDDEVMIERFVPGRELTVGVLGGEALPVGEIIPAHEIYDYEGKYTPGMAREVFPAELTAEETATVQELARRAYAALKLAGCARIDFRMAPDGTFYCLEANTLPGMTELSLIPQAAAAAGISFPELCERIATMALKRSGPR